MTANELLDAVAISIAQLEQPNSELARLVNELDQELDAAPSLDDIPDDRRTRLTRQLEQLRARASHQKARECFDTTFAKLAEL